MTVWTVGHSTRPWTEFEALLTRFNIEQVVDVRTAPGSRRNTDYGKTELPASLERAGIRYLHLPELGGFRRPRPDSPNVGWRNDGFRGFADYMATPAFAAGLDTLLLHTEGLRSALLCAEAVPWRCHRSLIADALTVRGIEVTHLLSATSVRTHRLTPFARVEGSQITYPLSDTPAEGREPSDTTLPAH